MIYNNRLLNLGTLVGMFSYPSVCVVVGIFGSLCSDSDQIYNQIGQTKSDKKLYYI